MNSATDKSAWARRRGFTFAEVLAAMVFMGVLIPVTLQGLRVSNHAAVVAARKRVAAQLADRTLTEAVLTGEWRDGSQQGDFGEDWPGYRWVLASATWDEDALQVVAVEVFYQAQGREHSVWLSTLAEEDAEAEGERP
jgi:type II secretory pathway pseudopilin PulG